MSRLRRWPADLREARTNDVGDAGMVRGADEAAPGGLRAGAIGSARSRDVPAANPRDDAQRGGACRGTAVSRVPVRPRALGIPVYTGPVVARRAGGCGVWRRSVPGGRRG